MYFLNRNLFSCYLLNLTFYNDILFIIYDPTKKIWISLEFYFENYEFYHF